MDPFPHNYKVKAVDSGTRSVTISAQGLPDITSAPPAEFDGPGDQWSPETLFLGAVADCFVLSFRAVADASGFAWTSLDCTTQGTLDRVERITRFTVIVNTATLRVPSGSSESQAKRLLEKAEQVCLISNSLNANMQLEMRVEQDS